ncbi:hypothetical protein EDE08_11899 [Bradyrhizobium sp. R2.2-H]|jgi:hypothetical protein|nr:hypothetical protein EDE10_11832 [Bradyrhizobium sp. Y-H1]TCU65740.1 hypothetical protein EDE08_11899 [Bradyrhizobium sp. R2.2-H]
MGDWRIALIEAHPQVFHAVPGKAAASRAYPRCGDGWRGLLERACERIEGAIVGGDAFVARQISQRLGTLRFYWSGKLGTSSQSLIADAVSRAEACSHCTCEECGAPGRLYRAERFLVTRCIVHAIGIVAPIEPGFENVHLVQKIVDSRASIAACRYDQATDAFIEIGCGSQHKDEVPGQCLENLMGPRNGIDWLRCTKQGARLLVSHRRNYSRARRYF